MSSDTPSIDAFTRWHNKIIDLNIRGLVLITPEHALLDQIHELFKERGEPCLFIDNYQGNSASKEKVDSYLGGESKVIFFDASKVFDPNSFAAVSGTLIGGGVLLLVINEAALSLAIALSSLLPDSSQPTVETTDVCPLLTRVIRFHINNRSTAIVSGNDFLYSKSLLDWHQEATQQFSIQQAELIEKIERVAKGHANRPLVITANRGRGKSAALGIAASHLIEREQFTIIVTAPGFKNLAVFYHHLLLEKKAHFESAENRNLKKLQTDNGSQVIFMPVDEIIRTTPKANLLVIDEAAAIPVGQLDKLSQRFNRMVFATTTYGYEGNGKGFEVRFKKRLLQTKPNTRFATLQQPIRWAEYDELEPSSFKALLLDCQLSDIDCVLKETNISDQLTLELINRHSLSTQEADLRNIFALLINAHYQTRPADLKTILTQPNINILVGRWKNRIVSVALVNQEGNLSSEVSERISNAKLRLKGELLPQSIIAHYGLAEVGSMSFYRVMRIAVHPQLQKKGVGSRLLSYVTELAQSRNISFVGASFAATDDVVNFWVNNNFSCIRFGSSKDSSSGAHSLEVLKPLTQNADGLNQILQQRFKNSFLIKLHDSLSDLELPVISCIILTQFHFTADPLSDYEMIELQRFSEGKRGFLMVDDLAIKLFKQRLANIRTSGRWKSQEIEFLIDCLFVQSNMTSLTSHFGFNGKKQTHTYLRSLVQKLLPT